MAAYRLYCLDASGKIDLAQWIEATDDAAAIDRAHELKRDALKCEVWQKKRLVAKLERQALSQ